MRKSSILLKIFSLILLPLLATIFVILWVSADNQKENLLTTIEQTVSTTATMLNVMIRNLMLNGEAHLVVGTLENLQKIQDIQELEIYRIDGDRAFHDLTTLERVNDNLKKDIFKATGRIPNKTIDNGQFREVLNTNIPKEVELRSAREMEYYFPILNTPECWKCHGSDHFVRGVTYIKISTKSISDQVQSDTLLLLGVFIIAAVIVITILVLSLRRIVVNPVLGIGNSINRVWKGHYDARVPVKSNDELGRLGQEINKMIRGLEERLRLSKSVSRTAENLIRQRGKIRTGGDRQLLTIFFSHIHHLDSYADDNPPDRVIESLNRIQQVHAQMVEKFHGDMERFSGNRIMAIFTDEYKAIQCAYGTILAMRQLDRQLDTGLFTGIGIDSGEVVLGNTGSGNQPEYAFIGDVVNFASNLSRIAKENMILISETVMEKVQGKVSAKCIVNQWMEVKTQKINFYVVKSILNEKSQKWMK